MPQEQFGALMAPVIDAIAGKPVDRALAESLNQQFPDHGDAVAAMEQACHFAINSGWMCSQGGPGRRFGRVIEASPATKDLSVDVVDLTDIVGPLHRHPDGEICLIMPVDPEAKFDGKGRGWCVYGPGSAHRPTVKGGRALVLYLLPGGKIEFQE
ncbi:MAG: DUF4863 family protein [Rhodospirillaceae bacterium]|nr:DUF4863 family protein [Rhodospirillaceae bacterium]